MMMLTGIYTGTVTASSAIEASDTHLRALSPEAADKVELACFSFARGSMHEGATEVTEVTEVIPVAQELYTASCIGLQLASSLRPRGQ
mmetsp:Transcript_20206/g.30357  ORF Transcript_20206/g.30357 Transcript_20206/m.30357 type:complete len:88 (+) Transcript_20206:77-340(+)